MSGLVMPAFHETKPELRAFGRPGTGIACILSKSNARKKQDQQQGIPISDHGAIIK
jgi:hypothetical protein